MNGNRSSTECTSLQCYKYMPRKFHLQRMQNFTYENSMQYYLSRQKQSRGERRRGENEMRKIPGVQCGIHLLRQPRTICVLLSRGKQQDAAGVAAIRQAENYSESRKLIMYFFKHDSIVFEYLTFKKKLVGINFCHVHPFFKGGIHKIFMGDRGIE